MQGGNISGKTHNKGIRFNVVSVARGYVDHVKFPGENCYIILEWHLNQVRVNLSIIISNVSQCLV